MRGGGDDLDGSNVPGARSALLIAADCRRALTDRPLLCRRCLRSSPGSNPGGGSGPQPIRDNSHCRRTGQILPRRERKSKGQAVDIPPIRQVYRRTRGCTTVAPAKQSAARESGFVPLVHLGDRSIAHLRADEVEKNGSQGPVAAPDTKL